MSDEFSLERWGSTVTFVPTRTGLGKIRVNGELLSASRVLQDGDFVQIHHETYIFQSNPVADRRQRMLKAFETQAITVTPSQRLRAQIELNANGFLIQKTKMFIAWSDIVRMEFRADESWPLNRHNIAMNVYRLGQVKPVKARIRFLKKQDFFDLLNWFSLVLPFDLSIADFRDVYGGTIRNLLPDAYLAAVDEKIIRPAEEGKRTLPASRNVLSGFAPVIQSGQILLGIVSGALVLALIVGLATQNNEVILLSLFLSVYPAAVILRILADKWSRSHKTHSG